MAHQPKNQKNHQQELRKKLMNREVIIWNSYSVQFQNIMYAISLMCVEPSSETLRSSSSRSRSSSESSSSGSSSSSSDSEIGAEDEEEEEQILWNRPDLIKLPQTTLNVFQQCVVPLAEYWRGTYNKSNFHRLS